MLAGINGHAAFPAFGGVPWTDGDIFRVVTLTTADTQPNRAERDQQEQSESGDFHWQKKD
jgi:hypothetical protein